MLGVTCNFNRQLLDEKKQSLQALNKVMLSVNGNRVLPFNHGKPMKRTEQLQAPLAIYHEKAGDNMRRVCLSRAEAYPCLLSCKPNKKLESLVGFRGDCRRSVLSPAWKDATIARFSSVSSIVIRSCPARTCKAVRTNQRGQART